VALGLSVIFGMLRIVNFAHGAMFMLGAFVAYYGAQLFHLPFYAALVSHRSSSARSGCWSRSRSCAASTGSTPSTVCCSPSALVLIIEDAMRLAAGALGSPYAAPPSLAGVTNLGFTLFPRIACS